MHSHVSFVVIAALAASASAQERYWVPTGTGMTRIDPSGFASPAVPPGTARDIAVAPDGKVWIIAGGVTVLNPDGTLFTTITPSAGITPYALAIDRAGDAWLTGSSGGVERFSPAGTSLGTLTLTAASPRQITVDADGNKWIAHRVGPPGSLSRIDAVTGAITNHPLPLTSLILPISVYASARGLLASSHIWTAGDNRGAGELVELDAAGNVLNTYVLGATARLLWMSGDCDSTGVTRNIWVGDWSNGDLHRVDAATGTFATFPQGLGVGGVTFDGFGNLWITMRSSGGVRRIDEAAGTTEINAALPGVGDLGTLWRHATVVDQLGDLDGDGAPNLVEVMAGSSPFDGCSLPNASLAIRGPMSIGSTLTVELRADPGVLSLLGFAAGTVSPGLSFPGFGCAVVLDPASVMAILVTIGPANLNLTIPNSGAFVGYRLVTQALNDGVDTFTNVAPMLFF